MTDLRTTKYLKDHATSIKALQKENKTLTKRINELAVTVKWLENKNRENWDWGPY